MAVDVVDGLEMVEIEQEQRNLAPFRRRLGDQRLSGVQQRAAVEKAGQRIGVGQPARALVGRHRRSEEHTSELQSLMRISYAVFCLKKKKIRLHRTPLDKKERRN